MSKKKAKMRVSAGERIMCTFYLMSIEELRREDTEHGISAAHHSRKIDRAIRAAVKKTWRACEHHEAETSESHKAAIKGQIEQQFGVKL